MIRKTIGIVSLSPVARDARVLRQVAYLSPSYDLVVAGEGEKPASWSKLEGVSWVGIRGRWRTVFTLLRLPLAILSRFGPRSFAAWYWSSPNHRSAFARMNRLLPARTAAIHANDWNTLPIALRLARLRRAKVVLDLHEYAPLEFEERQIWRLLYSKPVAELLRRSAKDIDASITVAPKLAERFRAELDLDPITVLNAPDLHIVGDHPVDQARIRLIHHGVAQAGRRLELTMEAISHTDDRFRLDLMLVGNPGYINHLERFAERVAPGRIRFRDPVSPEEIVPTLAEYDAGIFVLPPASFNMSESLPNKLFDFVGAGLAIFVGPTPGMAAFVREHGVGLVTRSFDAGVIAEDLNGVERQRLDEMRAASRVARQTYNAQREMRKVLDLYDRLVAS